MVLVYLYLRVTVALRSLNIVKIIEKNTECDNNIFTAPNCAVWFDDHYPQSKQEIKISKICHSSLS